MEYLGKLYVKIRGQYVELIETAEDFDKLKEQNIRLKKNIEVLESDIIELQEQLSCLD